MTLRFPELRSPDFRNSMAMGKGGGGLAPYLGVVATRGTVPMSSQNTQTAAMGRSSHWSRDALTSIAITVPNFMVDSGAGTFLEKGMGAASTVKASIEYPAGTFTQVKFSGVATGNIADGAMLTSDFTAVNIPNNTQFWVRMFITNPNGFFLSGFGFDGSTANGDRYNTFDGDKTLTGTVSSQFDAFVVPPVEIIGMTMKPSGLLIGTSRTRGHRDTIDASGDIGVTARTVGASFGYIQSGVVSDLMSKFIASHAKRVALAAHVSFIMLELGTNDPQVQGTLAANFATIVGYYTGLGKKIFAVTASPSTSSTDSWATLVNQTIATDFSTWNTYLKTVPAPLTAVFDVASIVSNQAANKWNVDGTAGKWVSTLDGNPGVHETQFANLAIASSGIINTALLAR